MRKKFVAVIGPSDSGKSTVIRSLTGVLGISDFYGYIEDRSTGLKIYFHSRSPQEHVPENEEIFKELLEDVSKDKKVQGIIFAIQPTTPQKRLSMDKMFELTKKADLENYAFILDPPYGKASVDYEEVKKRVMDKDPFAHVFKLDGRRFAILNAEAIRALSRFPY
jgi:energy-coupling factor transporter ATP-binding protein EcfA2